MPYRSGTLSGSHRIKSVTFNLTNFFSWFDEVSSYAFIVVTILDYNSYRMTIRANLFLFYIPETPAPVIEDNYLNGRLLNQFQNVCAENMVYLGNYVDLMYRIIRVIRYFCMKFRKKRVL